MKAMLERAQRETWIDSEGLDSKMRGEEAEEKKARADKEEKVRKIKEEQY
jgi:hypothetical protein